MNTNGSCSGHFGYLRWVQLKISAIIVLLLGCFIMTIGGCEKNIPEYNVKYIQNPVPGKVQEMLQSEASKNHRLIDTAIIPPMKDAPDSVMVLIFEAK